MTLMVVVAWWTSGGSGSGGAEMREWMDRARSNWEQGVKAGYGGLVVDQ